MSIPFFIFGAIVGSIISVALKPTIDKFAERVATKILKWCSK